MIGDAKEIQISYGTMGDGVGAEIPATVVRIWVDAATDPDDPDAITVSAELRIARGANAELDSVDDLLQHYLAGFGLGEHA